MPVAIVSAAPFVRIGKDVLSHIAIPASKDAMFIFSENAAQCRSWDGREWTVEYTHALSPEEREFVSRAVEAAVAETGALSDVTPRGERLLVRESSVTLAALGIDAPTEERLAWDPGRVKRIALQTAIQKKLPDWNVYIGGHTSIDIAHHGVGKERAVEWLSKRLATPPAEMLFVGDALYEGGNDIAVVPTGIRTHQVSSIDDTERIIDELCAACIK